MCAVLLALAACACLPVLCQEIELPQDRDVAFVPGKRWAIVVGANEYEYYEGLNYAVRDARDMAETLIAGYGFDRDTVTLFTDDSDTRHTPTAGHILGELEAILSGGKNPSFDEGDLFLFFFSGHGVSTPQGDFLLPTDARPESVERVGLPVSELIDRFTRAGLQNVLIIVDACRTGAENQFGRQLASLGSKTKIAVLLGSAPGSRSWENDRLGHGVFAYHLLQALKDPDLRDPRSGALWASAVAERVREDVRTFTERDFGDSPQVPDVWADKTNDVLLAAYLASGDDVTVSVKEFLSRTNEAGLDTQSLVVALSAYADAVALKGRWDDVIELLKTADRLGRLTERQVSLLGIAHYARGRLKEADEILSRVVAGESGSFWYHEAAVFYSQLHRDGAQALKHAAKMWEMYPNHVNAYFYFNVLLTNGNTQQKLALIREFLQLTDLDDRETLALKGAVAFFENRFDQATELLEEAIYTPGRMPPDEGLIIMLAGAYVGIYNQGGAANQLRFASALRLLDRFISESKSPGLCNLYKGIAYQMIGQADASLAGYRAALKGPPYPGFYALTVVRNADTLLPELAKEVIAAAQQRKLSWDTQLAAYFAEAMLTDFDTAKPYLDSALDLHGDAVAVWTEVLDTAYLLYDAGFDRDELMVVTNTAKLQLVQLADDVGPDKVAWYYIALELWSEPLRMNYLLEKYGANLDGTELGRSDVARVLLDFYLNWGDDVKIDKFVQQLIRFDEYTGDARRLYALYLASVREDYAAAKAAMDGIKSKGGRYESLDGAINALVAAGLGNAQEAEVLLVADESANVNLSRFESERTFIRGLCGVLLKDKPLVARMTESVMENDYTILDFLGVAAYRHAVRRLRSDGDDRAADEAGAWLTYGHTGKPIIADFAWGREPDVGVYVGTYRYSVDEYSYEATEPGGLPTLRTEPQGTLTLRIDASGELFGSFRAAGGETGIVEGRTDEYGNLRATLEIGGGKSQLFAKLIPRALLFDDGHLRYMGQDMKLLDQSGSLTEWDCSPIQQ